MCRTVKTFTSPVHNECLYFAMRALLTLFFTCSAALGLASEAADSVDMLRRSLRQVSVSGNRVRSQLRSHGAESVLGMSLMRDMPRIFGNADPLHYAQMLPGVQTASEYDAGLHIQGSDNSHNMLGIDGVPIYNAAHLLGFFSVFNPSHFSSMRLSGSTLSPSDPNRIGGIVDMQVDDSIFHRTSGDVSVGPMSSQGTVRVGFGSRSSVVLSARASYLNLLYSRWLKVDGEDLDYFFHDYNLTYSYRPNVRNQLLVEAYYGGDDAAFVGSDYSVNTSLRWNNFMGAIHWRHMSGRLRLSQTAFYTRYANRFELGQTTASVSIPSSISTAGYKLDVCYGRMSAGLDVSLHYVIPQNPDVDWALGGENMVAEHQHALEASAWFGWHQPLGKAVNVSAGIRPTLYNADGNVSFSVDPTVEAVWHLSPASCVTLGGGIRHQYLFKVGFSDIGLPTEFWFASGFGQSAQYAYSASLTSETYLGRRKWRIEAAVYYKKLFNQLEYTGNVFDLIYDDYSLDKMLLCGEGYNYGLNLLVERRKGRLTGWVSYSFGRARRRYPGTEHEGWYPATHERPHEFNAVATLKLGSRWSLGATFVIASGTPYTRVERFFMIGNHVLSDYGRHNAERLPPYMRLDLSVSYDFSVKNGRRSGINLSLYNATAHDNVLFYRLKVNEYEYAYRPFSFALKVMPSLNYYYSF